MEKESQASLGAFQGEGTREEDHDQQERQRRREVSHLRRRLDGFPNGEVHHDPRGYQARHELPSQYSRLLDSATDLQNLIAEGEEVRSYYYYYYFFPLPR